MWELTIGSEKYKVGSDTCVFEDNEDNTSLPSKDMLVYNKLTRKWSNAPSMTVARKNAVACSFDSKIYVMGGCEVDRCWAEVFDTKTQTWESLPDLGWKNRSTIRALVANQGKIYMRTANMKDIVFYDIKESRWKVKEANLDGMCKIDNVLYSYDDKRCRWYDSETNQWKLVKGLSILDQYFKVGADIGVYGKKLVVFWVGPGRYPLFYKPEIWCAVILLEKRDNGEIWGQTEWIDHVLTVPAGKYTFWRCKEISQ